MMSWPPVWENTVVRPPLRGASTWLAIVEPIPTTLRLLDRRSRGAGGEHRPEAARGALGDGDLQCRGRASRGKPREPGDVDVDRGRRPRVGRNGAEFGTRVSSRRVGLTGMNRPGFAASIGM